MASETIKLSFEQKLEAFEKLVAKFGSSPISDDAKAMITVASVALADPDFTMVVPKQAEEQKAEEPKPEAKAEQKDEGQKEASLESLKANSEVVETILATVEGTNDTIERLVAAGKKFNASRAKSDLHKIASKVSEIVANVDLAAPWVKNDLVELSRQADEIHALFPAANA